MPAVARQKAQCRAFIRELVGEYLETHPHRAKALVWLFLNPLLAQMTLNQLAALFALIQVMAEEERPTPQKGAPQNESPEP